MSLVQGGSGFPYMAPPMYDYLCGIDILSIKVILDDVPSCEVRKLLQQVVGITCTLTGRMNVHPSMLNVAFYVHNRLTMLVMTELYRRCVRRTWRFSLNLATASQLPLSLSVLSKN